MYLLITLFTKIIYFFIKLLRLGNGYTWPGHIILSVYPNIFKDIKKHLPNNIIVVSGTNGKTTTSKLIKHILRSQGNRVLLNETGANLLNGLVSMLLLNTSLNGSLPYDYIIFEIDELTLPHFLSNITPRVLILLNLSRDQLDRHFELDTVLNKWQASILALAPLPQLILPKNDAFFRPLSGTYSGSIHYFEGTLADTENTPLQGIFNAHNISAAILCTSLFNIDVATAKKTLVDFDAAFGRGETLHLEGKNAKIFLAKNPLSLNNNLHLLTTTSHHFDTLLFILNDNIPDGLDVSWIYDIDPTLLYKACAGKKLYVSGTRALDMAVRLKYAHLEVLSSNVVTDTKKILKTISKDASVSSLVILPNYSAMLEVRKIILGKNIL